jgi:hypothetical protein
MTPAANWLAASAIALLLSTAYLLDGPSELDAARATAASVTDAQHAAQQAAQAARVVTAQVQP